MNPPPQDALEVPTDTELNYNQETNIRMLKPGTPSAINPQSSYHSTNSIQSLPSLPPNTQHTVNGERKIVNAATLVLPTSPIVETSPSIGTEPLPSIPTKNIVTVHRNATYLNPNYNPFTDIDTNTVCSSISSKSTTGTVAVERINDMNNMKSKSCRTAESENESSNCAHKLVLRPVKSDGNFSNNNISTTVNVISTGNVALCLLPPTSIVSMDEISSEDIEHDYGLNMEKSQMSHNAQSLPTRVPVLRKPYSNSDPKTQYQYSSITNVSNTHSVATDSSGAVSNSMLSPKYGLMNGTQKRVRAKSTPKTKRSISAGTDHINQNTNINYNNNVNVNNYNTTQQSSKKPLTPQVLCEKKEFVVPLSVIEAARSLDETVTLDGNPSSPSKSVRIHRNMDHLPSNMLNTQLNHNLSNSTQVTQLSYGSNPFNEVSYTQNTRNSMTNHTDTHGTYYSTKSARLVRMRDNKQSISVPQGQDTQSVSMQSAPTTTANHITITRVESESKDSNHSNQTKRSRKSKMRKFFRVNKKPKTMKSNTKDMNITMDTNTVSLSPYKCKSLPVTPHQVDSSSSPSSVQSTGHTMMQNRHRMLRHSEPDKYGQRQQHDGLNMNNQKMDESVTQSVSIQMYTMKHGDHAFSAPEEEIMNHYQNAQAEIEANAQNKSTALMDMMVSYGWTDQALLSSLQSLRRFSR
eukprot:CAMPEP_0201595878 /NCGR_PEP_ID=MMETSP0190_2-20130828/192736_1 /ASSEMBLY_ACC=CAM_ASM_000263 /TAXON_ID=37353 /ORGANISM="Rosalina sp." /LENGTH=689 /DNA_ID=CAMNT_0048056015 /DNA_START=896 /DNA_END=2965 /DNA_ORIENTATION=-